MQSQKIYVEPEKKLPVSYDVDVLVCGGGPSGIAAAVSAAKNGAEVLLIERFNCLGGQGTVGLVTSFMSMSAYTGGRQVIKGVFEEFTNLLEEMGGCIKPPHLAEERPYFSVNRHEPDTAICPFDPEMYKIAADRLVEKYGIKVLFHTYITAAIMEGKTIRGVIIENKSGRQAVYAKRVIDCTGDGDVIAYTGAPFETGVGEKDGEEVKSPVSTMFCMDGLAPDTVTWKVDKSLAYGAVNLFPLMKEDEFRAEMTRVTGINPCSAEDITKGEIACRKQILEVLDWLHHNYKGTEHARLTKVANMMGMMVSRRIVAEYKVTRDDILNYTIFDDAISMNAYGVDIHNPNGGGCELYWLIPGHAYSIPYRALLPLEVENIIAAGRCIAHDGIAVMATCYGTGEAAGAAAALSIKEDVPFRKLSVKKLQEAFMMNMEEDIHGNNILKEYMSIVSRRKSLVNGYMISSQFFQIVGHVYKMYHVLNRRQKYIFHSAIENITKRKSWRRNAFMCMKDYGAKKGIGKIRIIHLIGQKVSFARRSICLCMRILIWKEQEYC